MTAKIKDLSPKMDLVSMERELVFPSSFQDQTAQLVGGLTAGSRELTQGKIHIQGVDERILVGDVVSFTEGVGVYIGKDPDDGLYKFRAGDPAGININWDGAQLNIYGFLEDGEAANDVNTNVTTINGGKITALSITAAQIAAQTITSDKITTGEFITLSAQIKDAVISSAKIISLEASKITSQIVNAQIATISWAKITSVSIDTADIANLAVTNAKIADLSASKINTGTLNATNVNVTNLNATNINNGTFSVGGAGKVSQMIVTSTDSAAGSGAYLRFGSASGSRIWSDSGNDMGFNAIGGQMYFYCDSAQILYLDDASQAIIGQDNTSYDVGLYVWGNLNTGRGDVRFKDAKVRINTSSSPSEQLYVEGDGKFIGNITTEHHDPRSSNSYNQGGSSKYWAYVNCHDVSYHSLGFYDDGVTLPTGKKVSDVEAIKLMRPHPTLKTKDGAPLLDKASLPKEMHIKAVRQDGSEYERDSKTGYPIIDDDDEAVFDEEGNEKRVKKSEIRSDADGESGAQLLALALGAIRELSNEIDALKNQVSNLKPSKN